MKDATAQACPRHQIEYLETRVLLSLTPVPLPVGSGGLNAIPAALAPASTPFHGTPVNVATTTVEAEDFDNGGEGIAYHDTTPQNITGAYRTTGVDLAAVSNASNGFAVGYTAPGEWLKYSISAPVQQTYAIQARVANFHQGGTFHIAIDGTDVTGTLVVPDTGPWDTWQTITSKSFSVSAGNHTMQVVMDSPGYWGNIGDFDSFKFVLPAPFHGTPFNINTDTIEAEDFNNGGEGVAYHDTTSQNINGKYRPTESVDINAGGTNGYSVGYTAPGEWLNYAINAPSDGTYVLNARVADYLQGGTFHVEIDGQNVTGTMTVPNTGPWDTWQTITSQSFQVTGGNHTMKVVMDSPGVWGNIGDFDNFQFATRAPFGGTPFKVASGTLEAENFDNGPEGTAYLDTTTANLGGKYRNTAVDINAGGSNGYSVGYTATGEWLNYSITSPTAGTFVLQSAVASLQKGGTFHVQVDGQNVTGTMTVPDTGGWFNWQTLVSPKFSLSAGDHVMKVVMDSQGTLGAIGNFDYFRFAPAGIITMVSQDRSVTTSHLVKTDPGDFGAFNVTLANGAVAHQFSQVQISPTGAELLAKLDSTDTAGSTSYKMVFDVTTPVTYTIHFTGDDVFTLTGPVEYNDVPFDIEQNHYFAAGLLPVGRYTISGTVTGKGDSDLTLEIGSNAIARPLIVGQQTIEAENFDQGPEGVAYHDTEPFNFGGVYRATGVDIGAGGSYAFYVGYVDPGEWLKYTIDNPSAGDFMLQSAVASSMPGGTFHVEIDGQNVTGAMTVPDTGGWTNFQPVNSPKFSLSAGQHTMRVVMDTAGALGAIGNFDYFRFVPTGLVTPVSQHRSVEEGDFQTTHSDPGNFDGFTGTVGDLASEGVEASQSSNLLLSATGAQFLASADLHATSGGLPASTTYQWVFDLSSAVKYTVNFDYSLPAANASTTLTLVGPGGAELLYNPSDSKYFIGGTFQPGRYTLSATGSTTQGAFQIQLALKLGTAVTG